MADTYNSTHNNTNLTRGDAPIDHPGDAPLEKDFTNGYHLDNGMDSDTALKKIRTAGSISISPELFEKIYLSPQNAVKGDLRKTFGNPTPLCLCGFLLSLSPLSCILMGWRGAGGSGASDIGAYFFFGGLLMVLGAVGEFFLGNTFPCVVFGSFGAFWLTFGATLQPFYNAYGAFSTTTNPAEGLNTLGFNASLGFFFLFMGLLCLIYFVCSLRTNIVFAIIFLTLVVAFGLLTGAYWQLALAFETATPNAAHIASAGRLLIAAGAVTFVTDLAGWWIFAAIMLAALDFPLQLPVGDLSHLIAGASERAKAKEERYEA